MSYSYAASRNRKEKKPNEGSQRLRDLAHAEIRNNPEKYIQKLIFLFIEKDSVLAANMLIRLADAFQPLPDPASNNRLLELLAKWTCDPAPEPTPEPAPSPANPPTPPAAAANPAEPPAATPATAAVPDQPAPGTPQPKTTPETEPDTEPETQEQPHRPCRTHIHSDGPPATWTTATATPPSAGCPTLAA